MDKLKRGGDGARRTKASIFEVANDTQIVFKGRHRCTETSQLCFKRQSSFWLRMSVGVVLDLCTGSVSDTAQCRLER